MSSDIAFGLELDAIVWELDRRKVSLDLAIAIVEFLLGHDAASRFALCSYLGRSWGEVGPIVELLGMSGWVRS